MLVYNIRVLMRDEKEGKKKQARSNKQQGKATANPRQSLFLRKMSCLGWDMYMYMYIHSVYILPELLVWVSASTTL